MTQALPASPQRNPTQQQQQHHQPQLFLSQRALFDASSGLSDTDRSRAMIIQYLDSTQHGGPFIVYDDDTFSDAVRELTARNPQRIFHELEQRTKKWSRFEPSIRFN